MWLLHSGIKIQTGSNWIWKEYITIPERIQYNGINYAKSIFYDRAFYQSIGIKDLVIVNYDSEHYRNTGYIVTEEAEEIVAPDPEADPPIEGVYYYTVTWTPTLEPRYTSQELANKRLEDFRGYWFTMAKTGSDRAYWHRIFGNIPAPAAQWDTWVNNLYSSWADIEDDLNALVLVDDYVGIQVYDWRTRIPTPPEEGIV